MLHPIARRHRTLPRRRSRLRDWWHRRVSAPLDRMYKRLDEEQQRDE